MSEPKLISLNPSNLDLVNVVKLSEDGVATEAVGLSFNAPHTDTQLAFIFSFDGDTDRVEQLKLALEEVISIVQGGDEYDS